MSYTKGQLVWAKIKGYPWWPAVVQIVSKPNQDKNSSQEKEVLVNFIGENSHAVLTYDKVADFAAKFKTHSSSKNKKLQDSIKVAQRILSGESTYEEEREKLIATLQAEAAEVKQTTRGRPSTKKKMELGIENPLPPRDPDAATKLKEAASKSKDAAQKEKAALYKFKEDVLGLKKSDSPQKDKPAVSKEKEPVQKAKESPKSKKQAKDSRLTQKQKAKEKEKEKKREVDEFQDYVPFRLTRSQVRRDPVETHVEPEVKNKKRGASTRGKKAAADKNAKETKENIVKPGRGKGRLLLDDDDSLNDYHIKKQGEPKMDEEHIPSPAKLSERKFSGGKLDFEEEKNPQAQAQMNAETSVSRTSEGRMEVEIHTEPAIGSLKSLEAHNTSTADSLALTAALNNKRANSAVLKEPSTIYASQVKDKETQPLLGEAEYNEYITKKMKLASNAPPEEDKVLDERVLGTEVYNMLLIKKFEENLSRILDKLSNKLQGTDRLKEYDVDMIKILEIIEEFESRSFNGSEFIGSDLGKILKTIHFLLIKNKTRLPKTGDLVITALAKILHKIKDGIIKYCLDNTEYMDALRLPQEAAKPNVMAAIDIDFEEIKAKIEEMGDETKAEAAPIATKIEEESTSAYSNVQKQPAQTAEAAVTKPQPVQSQPAATAAPIVTQSVTTTTTTKEIPKDTVKGSPIIKPADSNPNEITLLLRKKICQKLARLLQRSYHMDKDKSQELTLRIEDKLNKYYLGNANEYKQAIKGLHKLIKVQILSLDDLTHVLDMTLDKFKQMLKEKLPEIADAHGNADNDHDLTPQHDPADLVRREPPLTNEDPSTFDFQAYLASKIDNDPTLNSLAKKESEALKQKLIVEEPNTLTQDAFNTKEDKH